MNDSAIDVPAHHVAAHDQGGIRWRKRERRIRLQRIVGSDDVGEDRGEDKDDENRAANGAERVAAAEMQECIPPTFDMGASSC